MSIVHGDVGGDGDGDVGGEVGVGGDGDDGDEADEKGVGIDLWAAKLCILCCLAGKIYQLTLTIQLCNLLYRNVMFITQYDKVNWNSVYVYVYVYVFNTQNI